MTLTFNSPRESYVVVELWELLFPHRKENTNTGTYRRYILYTHNLEEVEVVFEILDLRRDFW